MGSAVMACPCSASNSARRAPTGVRGDCLLPLQGRQDPVLAVEPAAGPHDLPVLPEQPEPLDLEHQKSWPCGADSQMKSGSSHRAADFTSNQSSGQRRVISHTAGQVKSG